MRGVLSKFIKQIVIEQYFSCLPIYGTVELVDSLAGYFKRNDLKDLLFQFDKQLDFTNKRILLTDHAHERWNQRVAFSNEKAIIEGKLNILLLLGRIEFITREIGLIDKEVLFTYEQMQDRIIITTIYGRLSQNPSLYHFKEMRNYNLHSDDYIDLAIDGAILSSFSNPPVPTQRMVFRGSTSLYLIDKYSDKERSLFILLVLDGPEKGTLREIYSDQPSCEKIEKSVRQAIMLMGHIEFVYNHIAFHYPEELSKRIRRLKGE